MLFVASIPGYVWSMLLVAAWLKVAAPPWRHPEFRQAAMASLCFATALQGLAAISVAVATHRDSISTYACTLGAYGSTGTAILTLTQAPAVCLLYFNWPGTVDGAPMSFPRWLAAWIVFSALAALLFLRSAALCTG